MLGEQSSVGEIWYIYDGTGEVSGFKWNGTDYYYVKNQVGDVTAIADTTGNILCTYEYDVWGQLTGMEGDTGLREVNPLRHRGYYYDKETGFYYLVTRYYDPEIKRFLNRDMLDNETNLYQYGYNNPVMYSDESGMSSSGCKDTNIR